MSNSWIVSLSLHVIKKLAAKSSKAQLAMRFEISFFQVSQVENYLYFPHFHKLFGASSVYSILHCMHQHLQTEYEMCTLETLSSITLSRAIITWIRNDCPSVLRDGILLSSPWSGTLTNSTVR